MRDRVAVVAEVVVIGVLEVLVRGLQLDEDERDAVDEADEIGAALVEVRVDPELGDEQEIVVLRMLPVDDGELLWELVPSGCAQSSPDWRQRSRVRSPIMT